MVHDLAFVLIGVPVFFAFAIGRGTTKGPFHDDLPNATIDALIAEVCGGFCRRNTYPELKNCKIAKFMSIFEFPKNGRTIRDDRRFPAKSPALTLTTHRVYMNIWACM